MLQENILKEKDIAEAINIKVQRILSKFVGDKPRDCCEKEESRTLIDYQRDINYALDETLKNLNILEEAIGD